LIADDVRLDEGPAAGLIAALYRDHASALRRYLLRRFGPGPPEPEDLIQAAFFKLSQQEDLPGLRDPRGFLYAIACNLAIDGHRRLAHRGQVQGDMARLDTVTLSDPTPERVLLDREQLLILEEALKRMPAMRRRIFLLARVEGRPTREIAKAFGLSENAVHKHVSRALAECAASFAAADTAREDP
jgi:RNA polymerase sigma-70 factor (ECF subfamily)